jgi:hypothetical protein
MAARTSKAPAIDTCSEERGTPASADPPAKILWYIAKPGVGGDDQKHHAWDKREGNEQHQKITPAKILPTGLIL